jgi:L,D-transpeptidase YcbB
MKVVVGRQRDSTPVFSDRVTAITVNPAWRVPDDIAKLEILPRLKEDASFLEKNGMELLPSWAEGAVPLRADSIWWYFVDTSEFKFKVRQKYGDGSALGSLKFVLTNPFDIYLHDTPQKEGFARRRRALSHGCVRLEKPVDLAAWLLAPQGEWDKEKLEAAIAGGRQRSIRIEGKGVPVHILYWTAFIDREGGLQFRPDGYGWDAKLEEALREKAPAF